MGEQMAVISELKQGMEHAKQLKLQLHSATSIQTRDFLVERVLSSYENALLALQYSEKALKQPESPISTDESPQSQIISPGSGIQQEHHQNASKKRKMLPRRTTFIRVSPESGMEGPLDDGHSWRKYGQKDILRAKYPRSYYRCTYRHMHNCWATKLVQRSDNDPTIFEVTYKGTHTCNLVNNLPVPVPASTQEKQEAKQKSDNRESLSEDVPWNYRPELNLITKDLDNKDMYCPFSFAPFASVENEEHIFDFPATPFISPATSESNYLQLSCCETSSIGNIMHGGQNSESDHAETISANTSASNSPIIDFDFLTTEPLDFGNFSFGNPGFSS